MLAHRRRVRWGTGDLGLVGDATRHHPRGCRPCRGAREPSRGRIPGACVKRGRRARIHRGAKYPVSSPPASVEPQRCGKPNRKFRRGAVDAPPFANSVEFTLPSVSGSSPRSLRQAPRAWARACPRGPRDPGLPFRLAPGSSDEPCFGQQKTLRSGWLGRVRVRRTVDLALCEIAPMSRAHAVDRPEAVRQSAEFFKSVMHHRAHVRSRTAVLAKVAGHTPRHGRCQQGK
ncbi:hypothetical protein ACVIHD_002063 [Bradyrhizobium embrapense]